MGSMSMDCRKHPSVGSLFVQPYLLTHGLGSQYLVVFVFTDLNREEHLQQ